MCNYSPDNNRNIIVNLPTGFSYDLSAVEINVFKKLKNWGSLVFVILSENK
jgi:hypothetical protein